MKNVRPLFTNEMNWRESRECDWKLHCKAFNNFNVKKLILVLSWKKRRLWISLRVTSCCAHVFRALADQFHLLIPKPRLIHKNIRQVKLCNFTHEIKMSFSEVRLTFAKVEIKRISFRQQFCYYRTSKRIHRMFKSIT